MGSKKHRPTARTTAARVLAEVAAGHSLSALLPPHLARLPAGERALAQELCYGTLRWWPRLDALASLLLEKPLRQKDRDVHTLLLAGLYQLSELAIPPHAAVSETVAAAEALGKGWARGLINGVLRRFQRERGELEGRLAGDEAALLAHPRWLLDRLRAAWPDDWRAIAEANNQRPPMTLRVNARQGDRDGYLEELAEAALAATPAPHGEAGLTLEHPAPTEALPGFDTGRVSVQDAAAQLAAPLVDPQPGERVLDACAAPGGKTAHLLERCPEAEVVALDRDGARLARVGENLQRLGLNAAVVAGDAGDPSGWWDGRPFDRILLDAPCSASGVIRRHPDIKLLRRDGDIPALVAEQARLLDALWPLLRPGGLLVYATCSILPDENTYQITGFLSRHEDARMLPLNVPWGHAQAAGRQILPGEDGMDGFYYARLSKA